MSSTIWRDFKVEKPKVDIEGRSALMLVTTTDVHCVVATYFADRGMWFDHETKELFGNVERWFDFPLYPGFRLSEDYDEGVL